MKAHSAEERSTRAKCQCESCVTMARALKLLDAIAASPSWMGSRDIEMLCKARELLAHEIGAEYDTNTSRYLRNPAV